MSDLLHEINKLSSPSFKEPEDTLQTGGSSIEEIASMSALGNNSLLDKDGSTDTCNLKETFAAEASSKGSDVGKFLKEVRRSLNEEDNREYCIRIVGEM